MKDQTFVNLLFIFLTVIIIGSLFIPDEEIIMKKQDNIAQIANDNKQAILDLIQEVNTLNMRQLELRYEIEQGSYDRDLFYIEAPKIEIGGCTKCH